MKNFRGYLVICFVCFLILMSAYLYVQREVNRCEEKIVVSTIKSYSRERTYAVCADGSGEVKYYRVPTAIMDNPEWSPNGKWVAFDNQYTSPMFGSKENQIYLYKEKTGRTIHFDDEFIYSASPSWSLDGKSIVFRVRGDVHIMDVSCIYSLKKCKFESHIIAEGDSPSISYDGKYIVIEANDKLQVIEIDHPEDKIDITPPGVTSCSNPVWSQIENKIVASCYSDNEDNYYNSDIYMIDLDSGEIKNLTEGSLAIEKDPKWSLDGSKIVFTSNRDKDLEKFNIGSSIVSCTALYTMNEDGTDIMRLTFASDESIRWYAWLP